MGGGGGGGGGLGGAAAAGELGGDARGPPDGVAKLYLVLEAGHDLLRPGRAQRALLRGRRGKVTWRASDGHENGKSGERRGAALSVDALQLESP